MTDRRSFLPVSGNVLPRFAGIPTFMRLPHIALEEAKAAGVEIGLIGVPWDGGTTNRPGARHGPRQMRDQSTLMRNVHHITGTQPYRLAHCADLGDTPVNPVDLMDSLERIEGFFASVQAAGIVPLSAGGDHLVTLPILKALGKDRPMGL
ncbi:MAG: arginase family protein, partial [Alphaproteobacteria bacterium]